MPEVSNEAEDEPICTEAIEIVRQLARPKDVDIGKQFIPLDLLRESLNAGSPSLAERVLACALTFRQKLHAILGPHAASSVHLKDTNGEASALILFSLFIVIGYPALITKLLSQNLNDTSLQQLGLKQMHQHLTRQEIWPWMKSVELKGSFETLLRSHLPMFAVPKFTHNRYIEFEADVRLPFIDENRLGKVDSQGNFVDEGGHSRVFEFRIWPGYDFLQTPEHLELTKHERQVPGNFVRKELSDSVPLSFLFKEVDSVQIMDELQSDNIVKVIKTYKHGEKFNIIFRREKADLNHFLRDKTWLNEAEALRQGPLETCKIWRHALGITEALGKISRIELPPSASARQRKFLNGFHFDLKPANILVSDTTWLITDFGLARFEQADEGATSRIFNPAGTDPYAPPEVMNVSEAFSRKYDVWSLGCILFEIVVFAIKGRNGLVELDKIRRTKTNNIIDSRFYCPIAGNANAYEVKSEIVHLKDSLKRQEKALTQGGREFLHQLLELIDGMLQSDVQLRLDIQKVIFGLRRVISLPQGAGTPHGPYSDPFPEPTETDDTPSKLTRMELFHFTQDGMIRGAYQSVPARLYIFRKQNGTLRLSIGDPSRQHKPTSFQISERTGRLVPARMFTDHNRMSFEDSGIGEYHDSTFEFTSTTDADYFQSLMTHQRVVASHSAENVTFTLPSSLLATFRLRDHSANDLTGAIDNVRIQLCTEDTGAFTVALKSPAVEGGPSLGMRPQEQLIPTRRMLVYAGDANDISSCKIISIIITGAIRYVHEDDRPPGLDSKKSRFVPNKPNSERYIALSVARTTDKDPQPNSVSSFPSIPLDLATLWNEERRNKIRCKQLDFSFVSETARKTFESDFYRFHRDRHFDKEQAEREAGTTRTSHGRKPSDHASRRVQVPGGSISGSSKYSSNKGKGKKSAGD